MFFSSLFQPSAPQLRQLLVDCIAWLYNNALKIVFLLSMNEEGRQGVQIIAKNDDDPVRSPLSILVLHSLPIITLDTTTYRWTVLRAYAFKIIPSTLSRVFPFSSFLIKPHPPTWRTFLQGFPAKGGLHVAQMILLALLQRAVLNPQTVRIKGVGTSRVELRIAVIAGYPGGH